MRMIDARLCDNTKRTTRSSIVSPSMRRIDDNTQTLFLCYVYTLYINRIKRALLQKEEKKKGKKISLFLSRNTLLLRFVRFSVFLRQLCKHPLEETGEARKDEKERTKERKEREKKDTNLKP